MKLKDQGKRCFCSAGIRCNIVHCSRGAYICAPY